VRKENSKKLSVFWAQKFRTRREISVFAKPCKISKRSLKEAKSRRFEGCEFRELIYSNFSKKAQAGNILMSFWFFFLLTIISVSISIGVIIYFGEEYDFRQVDANTLNEKILSCLEKNEINFEENENFFETCSLNEKVLNESYFIFIKKNNDRIFELGPGDTTRCALADKNIKFPRCTNSTIIKDEDKFFIQVGASQQRREKVG